ncbi:MAG: heavy metal-associated domain-containing protein [Myxococcota bacterium]
MRAVLAALVCWLAFPVATQAEFIDAELRVDGMACPFCAFGIEKKLRAVEGVRDLEVRLDEGIIELGFEADSPATVERLEKAVKAAGFGLGRLQLTVRGTLLADSSSPTLDAGGGGRFLLLEENDGRLRPIAAGTEATIRRTSANGVVVVRGEVHRHKDSLPGLVIGGGDDP